jgi:hypothetical protein
MTADEFENLDDQQAELWIAQRFRAFVLTGWPPDLSLMFAVHPEVDAPDGDRYPRLPRHSRVAAPGALSSSSSSDHTRLAHRLAHPFRPASISCRWHRYPNTATRKNRNA